MGKQAKHHANLFIFSADDQECPDGGRIRCTQIPNRSLHQKRRAGGLKPRKAALCGPESWGAATLKGKAFLLKEQAADDGIGAARRGDHDSDVAGDIPD